MKSINVLHIDNAVPNVWHHSPGSYKPQSVSSCLSPWAPVIQDTTHSGLLLIINNHLYHQCCVYCVEINIWLICCLISPPFDIIH